MLTSEVLVNVELDEDLLSISMITSCFSFIHVKNSDHQQFLFQAKRFICKFTYYRKAGDTGV